MKLYFVLCMMNWMLMTVSSIRYNQRCTFSSGTCSWNIGRRWQVKNLDEETDDQVLVAVDGSNEDKEKGFTDVVTSPWLYLTASCAFAVRLTFQFSIENEHDQIEVFLLEKNRTRISSLAHWRALLTQGDANSSQEIESLWQQANITFKARREFQIEIEIRHLPDNSKTSTTWFALDDILIESCPDAPLTTTTTTTILPTTDLYFNTSNSSLLHRSFFRFRWKFNDSSETSASEQSPPPRWTFLSFTLYLLYAFAAMTLLTIVLAAAIFAYRKYCLPPSTSSAPIIEYRYRSSKKKKKHPDLGIRHSSHIDQDARTERTMVTTIRPYF